MSKINPQKLGKVLLIGAGPAAFQTAKILQHQCERLGLASRKSDRWQSLFQNLVNNKTAVIEVAKSSLEPLAGEVKFDNIFSDLSHIEGQWDSIILATPSHAYADVLTQLPKSSLSSIKQVLLISSLFGGHQIVTGFFKELNLTPNIIVFSNYFAATKFINTTQTNTEIQKDLQAVKVLTKAKKKRIYIYSGIEDSDALNIIIQSLISIGIEVVSLNNAFSVEARNITAYVHPAFFITPFSLNHIISERDDIKFMYKLFPEGPVTTETIHTLVELWRDISKLVIHFKGTPFNLLQFLNDDNYPVHEESISREQINSFMTMSPIEQEYLIYVRYSAILIDPFSEPDSNGRYFDFSAVPYAKGIVNASNLYLPRVPKEDLQTLYWFKSLASYAGFELSTVNRVLDIFESWLDEKQLPKHLIKEFQTHAEKSLRWVI